MKLDIICNYGVLAHEKQWIYTCTTPHPHGKAYDTVTVEIPERLQPYETVTGAIAVALDGATYLLSDVLTSRNDEPCLAWFDGAHRHYVTLPVVERKSDTRLTDTRRI